MILYQKAPRPDEKGHLIVCKDMKNADMQQQMTIERTPYGFEVSSGRFVVARFQKREDARLFVAAGDLLQTCALALETIQAVYDFRTEDGDLPFNTVDYYGLEDMIEELKSAIARARGKEVPTS